MQKFNVMRGGIQLHEPFDTFEKAQSFVFNIPKGQKGNVRIVRDHAPDCCPATEASAKAYGRRNHTQWHADYKKMVPVG